MRKIIFGITSLTLGGAERVLVDMTSKLQKENDVTILTIYSDGEFTKELDPNVKLITIKNTSRDKLNKLEKIIISLRFRIPFLRRRLYKKYLRGKYDVEVAFLEGPITWLFSVKASARKIAWIHNDIKEVFGKGFKAKQKEKVNKKTYNKYDKLIFVSNDNLDKFEELYPNNKVTKEVIYNYLDSNKILIKSLENNEIELKNDCISFVQVSRLTEQKGLSRLIDVHTKLISDGIKHYIYIVGDGPLKNKLTEQIKNNNVEDSFILLGKRNNPYPYIKAADYFLLASLYEGYGMVIDEAKILNKYILITDTAAREAVVGYESSMVVSNDDAGIYNGIKQLVLNDVKINSNIKYDNQNIIDDITKMLGSD